MKDFLVPTIIAVCTTASAQSSGENNFQNQIHNLFLVEVDESQVSRYNFDTNIYTGLVENYEIELRLALDKGLVNLYMEDDQWILDIEGYGIIEFGEKETKVGDNLYHMEALTDKNISESIFDGVSLHLDGLSFDTVKETLNVNVDIKHPLMLKNKQVEISKETIRQIAVQLIEGKKMIHVPQHSDPEEEKELSNKVYFIRKD